MRNKQAGAGLLDRVDTGNKIKKKKKNRGHLILL